MVGAPAFSGHLQLGHMNALGDVVLLRGSDIRHSGEYDTHRWGRVDFRRAAQEGNGTLIVLVGHSYRIGSAIPSAMPSEVHPSEDILSYYIQLTAGGWGGFIPQRAMSPWFPMPSEVNDFSELVFECLENIRREKEHQAMQEQLRATKAAEVRAADKARAKTLRRRRSFSEIELEAAKEIQRKALETELFKTQTLQVQLEQEKLIIAAWNKVVEIRLSGAARAGEDYQCLSWLKQRPTKQPSSLQSKPRWKNCGGSKRSTKLFEPLSRRTTRLSWMNWPYSKH